MDAFLERNTKADDGVDRGERLLKSGPWVLLPES